MNTPRQIGLKTPWLRRAQWIVPLGLSLLAIGFETVEHYFTESQHPAGDIVFWAELGFFGLVVPAIVASVLHVISRAGDRLDAARQETEQLYAALQEKDDARRMLLGRIIDAHEAERSRIARHLHDSSGQALAALVHSAELARESGADQTDVLRHAHKAAAQALETMRQMIFDLRPPALEEYGLGPAIRSYASEIPGLADVHLEFTTDVPGRLPPGVELTLFRIAQEALSNVVRHAAARHVALNLSLSHGHVVLRIQDNGVGFARQSFHPTRQDLRGLGLLGMEERAALLDGQIEIVSEVGAGTIVTATIPLENQP